LVRIDAPLLVIFAGLPGVGKTKLAETLARRLRCAVLRVDALESAMLRAGIARDQPIGLAAYLAAEAVAETSLRVGADVIVDAVNAVEPARRSWINIATRTGSTWRVVEVICPDQREHQRRVTKRTADLEDHQLPTWPDVLKRVHEYEMWTRPRLIVDSTVPLEVSLQTIWTYLDGRHRNQGRIRESFAEEAARRAQSLIPKTTLFGMSR